MFRLYLSRVWFNHFDEVTEAAICDSDSLKRAFENLVQGQVPNDGCIVKRYLRP